MSDLTKNKLIQVAESLFSSRGFHATSIRNIASRAKTNIASVNYHFGDKYALYEAVLVRHFEEVRDRVDAAKIYSLSPKEQLLTMCGIMQAMHSKKAGFVKMIYQVMMSDKDKRLKRMTKRIVDGHIQPLIEHLQFASRKCCMGKKGKGKKLPKDAFVFLIMAVNCYWTLFSGEISTLFKKSPKTIVQEAFQTLNGFLSRYVEEV